MFCKKCGRELKDSFKFCAGCGSAVTVSTPILADSMGEGSPVASAAEVRLKKPFPLKTLLFILIPAIVAVVGIVFAINLFSGNLGRGSLGGSRNDILVTDSISFFREEERTIVAVNNEATFTVKGQLHTSLSSMDGSVATLITDYDWEFGGNLWLVTVAGATLIAEEVVYSIIAPSGKGVLYFTDWDERNEAAALYLYDVENDRSRRLANEAFHHPWQNAVTISPDGRSVGFVEETDGFLVGYLVINGETERLGENTIAVAIADNGRYVYFMRGRERDRDLTWSLYVRSGNEEVRLGRDVDTGASLLLNHDLSQAVLSMDGRALLSRNVGETERLSNVEIFGIEQPLVAHHWTGIWMDSWISVVITGIDSFANRVVHTWADGDANVLYINRDFEATRIPGTSGAHIHQSMLVDNGSTLIFLDHEFQRLERVALGDEQAEVERLGRNVEAFRASGDGRTIYFINEFSELWFLGGTGESHRIADGVHPWLMAMLPDSHKIFFSDNFDYRSGGILYFSENGESRQRVQGAYDVTHVWNTVTSIFYQNMDGDIYRSNGDGNFERVTGGDEEPESELDVSLEVESEPEIMDADEEHEAENIEEAEKSESEMIGETEESESKITEVSEEYGNGLFWVVLPTLEYEYIYYCSNCDIFSLGGHGGEAINLITGEIEAEPPEWFPHGGHGSDRLVYDPNEGLFGWSGGIGYGGGPLQMYPLAELVEHFPFMEDSLSSIPTVDSTRRITKEFYEILDEEAFTGNYGVLYQGEFITEFIFEDGGNGIVRENGVLVRTDFVGVKKGGLWGFVDTNGDVVIPFVFEHVLLIDRNTAFARYSGKYGILDLHRTAGQER